MLGDDSFLGGSIAFVLLSFVIVKKIMVVDPTVPDRLFAVFSRGGASSSSKNADAQARYPAGGGAAGFPPTPGMSFRGQDMEQPAGGSAAGFPPMPGMSFRGQDMEQQQQQPQLKQQQSMRSQVKMQSSFRTSPPGTSFRGQAFEQSSFSSFRSQSQPTYEGAPNYGQGQQQQQQQQVYPQGGYQQGGYQPSAYGRY